ncbi:MAG: aminopeptidase P family protein [Proteobacteria bacterium]|nr:aminopeptidase P family protein [Pseudomonadota bacterium]
MTDAATYRARRARLAEAMGGRPLLLRGHNVLPRNFALNAYPFRQDSTFLYFLGVDAPNASAVIAADGATTLYLPEPHADDPLWHGEVPPPGEVGALAGVDSVANAEALDGSGCLTLAVADPTVGLAGAVDSSDLTQAVVRLRLTRDADEIAQMEAALAVTAEAHVAAMGATHPGVTDTAVQAIIEAVFKVHGMGLAYPSIVTARGEVLHGHASGTPLVDGDLLLVDAGAETPGGYASDITRTWPVSGTFDGRQRAAYEAVLEAQTAAIELVRPGVRYREVHLQSARVLAAALVELGLLHGDVDGLVEQGAHAVFFPHGVGHLIGLDVHDMELYGDIGYPAGRERSDQFGLGFLRLDCDLEDGMVVTVEPGFYVVPAILQDASLRERFGDSVDWAAAEGWLGFGGIRIEDDVLATASGPRVLGPGIPRTVAEVEALVGIGPNPRQRLLPNR